MRRPPVILIIVAVLLTGVGVGWAARADNEAASLTEVAVAPDGHTVADAAPYVSSAEQSALIENELAQPEAAGVAREIDVVRDASTTPITSTPPAHLDDKVSLAVMEPAEVVTTTVAPTTTVTPATTVAAAPAAPAVPFTASQAYGSCDEPIPYDIFSGTAEPGSTVTISSPYGSGTTVSDTSGHWERKVEFPAAPRGETFAVTASGVGGTKTFSFVAGIGSH